jgi:hypothetical protein
MRVQDIPPSDGLDEYHVEYTTKRFGMSHTVERQIDRYRDLAAEDERVDREEVAALMRLAGRRADAALLFADAGRRAGVLAVEHTGRVSREAAARLPPAVGRRYARALARKALARIFDVELTLVGGAFVARARGPIDQDASPDGAVCAFYGSAIAAVLRAFMAFEGAVQHDSCRARGAEECRWSTGQPRGTDQ